MYETFVAEVFRSKEGNAKPFLAAVLRKLRRVSLQLGQPAMRRRTLSSPKLVYIR